MLVYLVILFLLLVVISSFQENLDRKKLLKVSDTTEQKRVSVLSVLHYFETDKAHYLVEETDDEFLHDVKVKRVDRFTGKVRYILEEELFEEGLGRMCGDSFHSFMVDVLREVRSHINKRGENILINKKIT